MWTLRHPLLQRLRTWRREAHVPTTDLVMRRLYNITLNRFGPTVISLYSSRTNMHTSHVTDAVARMVPPLVIPELLSKEHERIERLLSIHRHRSMVLASAHTPAISEPAGESDAVTVSQTRSTMVSRIERQIMFPRISLTMVRTQPPVSSPSESSPRSASSSANWNRGTRLNANSFPATAELFSLPAQELSRVTEHVIQTLDRRVLSYRERTGQV